MSPIDIRKTAPVAPVRTGPDQASPPPHSGAGPAAPARGAGVVVDVVGGAEAVSPPVDHDRVAQIRDALREGTYPIVPAKITDALIAARLVLGGQA